MTVSEPLDCGCGNGLRNPRKSNAPEEGIYSIGLPAYFVVGVSILPSTNPSSAPYHTLSTGICGNLSTELERKIPYGYVSSSGSDSLSVPSGDLEYGRQEREWNNRYDECCIVKYNRMLEKGTLIDIVQLM